MKMLALLLLTLAACGGPCTAIAPTEDGARCCYSCVTWPDGCWYDKDTARDVWFDGCIYKRIVEPVEGYHHADRCECWKSCPCWATPCIFRVQHMRNDYGQQKPSYHERDGR